MLKSKSFLAVDFGAGSLKLAEFEINEAGGLRLKQYALKPLGAEGSQESAREALIQKTLQEAITAQGIKAKTVNVCAPGFHVFSSSLNCLRSMPARSPRSFSTRRSKMCL